MNYKIVYNNIIDKRFGGRKMNDKNYNKNRMSYKIIVGTGNRTVWCVDLFPP